MKFRSKLIFAIYNVIILTENILVREMRTSNQLIHKICIGQEKLRIGKWFYKETSKYKEKTPIT